MESLSFVEAIACSVSSRNTAKRREPACAARNCAEVAAVTPDVVVGEFRNCTRNAVLFSTMSRKRKSRPNEPVLSGNALMNRTPAVGMAGVTMTDSGLHALMPASAAKPSIESRVIRCMKHSVEVETSPAIVGIADI